MYELLYEKMYKIRRFEETLLRLFSENLLTGTTHTGIGEEAIAVAVMEQVTDKDFVFSNHRCHGHFIAYSDRADLLLAEIMGKKNGVCKGRGGSQHLCYKNFFTNGIQGGIVPNATGLAFAEKLQEKDGIAVVFIGDGTLGQGVVYESFNIASLYSIPILYVVEDNGYAMSTKNTEGVAGQIIDRAKAFGISCNEIESNDVVELSDVFSEAFEYVRSEGKPFCQVVHTYRLGPHSKGDDYRDANEISEHKKKDPLLLLAQKNIVDDIETIQKRVDEELCQIVDECQRYEDEIELEFEKIDLQEVINESILSKGSVRVVTKLNSGLIDSFNNNKNAIILGEDICDPYGGAFKVTKGMSSIFPDRVLNMPISEAGFIGIGVGLAMNGIKPIVEMMFGDFITLGFDQLLNHATKYNWLYAGKVDVPLLIRVPMGGGRGYGATHSQTLEKYFIGMPNLQVIALSQLHDPHLLIKRIVDHIKSPTLFIENKKMYGEKTFEYDGEKINDFYVEEGNEIYPIYKLTFDKNEVADISIVTYGASVTMAMYAAEKLMYENEIMVDVICLTQISPINYDTLIKKIGHVKNVCILEEGTKRAGVGAEIIASLAEKNNTTKFKRIAAADMMIPASKKLEDQMLPSIDSIVNLLKGWCDE